MDLLDLKNIKSLSSKVADGVRYIEERYWKSLEPVVPPSSRSVPA